MPQLAYAISIKQPWAALLVSGLKSVEVRRWATARRGRVLIHAARIPDPRPAAWALVTKELRPLTELRGGIIGSGQIAGCLGYFDKQRFARDRDRHLNDPSWFEPPVLYGFSFTDLRAIPFRQIPGSVRFFVVPELEPHAR